MTKKKIKKIVESIFHDMNIIGAKCFQDADNKNIFYFEKDDKKFVFNIDKFKNQLLNKQ